MRQTVALLGNYFKRYVEREMQKGYMRRQFKPILGWREVKKRDWVYNEFRPWTDEFKRTNQKRDQPKVLVQPIKDWTIFKGDRVQILVGKDKGKQGIINAVIKERNWVFVEGLNCDYKMNSQGSTQPICVRDERPLLVTTQVKLVDPSDTEPTDVQWRYTEEGEKVRVSARTGRVIPLPEQANETEDMVLPSAYIENDEKDTKEEELMEVTFKPKLASFESDVMQQMDIKEDRKPAKTYWY